MLTPTFTNRHKWRGTHKWTHECTHRDDRNIGILTIADDKYEQRLYSNRLSFSIHVFFFYIFSKNFNGKM